MKNEEFENAIFPDEDEIADRILVDETTAAMKNKLELKRGCGRNHWWELTEDALWDMIDEHYQICRKHPKQIIDIINLLAMLRMLYSLKGKKV